MSKLFGKENSKVADATLHLDLRLKLPGRPRESHALEEPTRIAAIALVLCVGRKPKIAYSVVAPVPVDMVDTDDRPLPEREKPCEAMRRIMAVQELDAPISIRCRQIGATGMSAVQPSEYASDRLIPKRSEDDFWWGYGSHYMLSRSATAGMAATWPRPVSGRPSRYGRPPQ